MLIEESASRVTCTTGFADCDTKPETGCEAPIEPVPRYLPPAEPDAVDAVVAPDGPTRRQLLVTAGELGIVGRHRMSKEQLEAAVAPELGGLRGVAGRDRDDDRAAGGGARQRGDEQGPGRFGDRATGRPS